MENKIIINDLWKALAERKLLDKKEAQTFVQIFFHKIVESLRDDKYIKIKGLGTFKQVEVDPRESMNIHTGERFEIEGHTKISFTPDNTLKEIINRPFAHFETVPLGEGVTEEEINAVDQISYESEEKDSVVDNEEIKESIQEMAKTLEVSDEISESPKEEISPSDEPVSLEKPEPSEETVTTNEPDSSDKKEIIEQEQPVSVTTETANAQLCPQSPESQNNQSLTEGSTTVDEPTAFSLASSSVSDPTISEEMEVDDMDENEETVKHSKYSIIFACVLCLLGFGLGFLASYLMINSHSPKEIEVQIHDTVYVHVEVPVNSDTLHPDTTPALPVIRKDETTPPIKKSDASPAAKEKKINQVVEKSPDKPANSQVNYSQYPQLAGGAYWIVGTAQTYKLNKGETIRIIAERFFGSRQMAPYIIRYNGVSDPDHVAEGTVLNIPKLEPKKK